MYLVIHLAMYLTSTVFKHQYSTFLNALPLTRDTGDAAETEELTKLEVLDDESGPGSL